MKASEALYREISVIPTGLASLDDVTGIGGIPFRRITEVYGPRSVGKTTLAFSVVAQAQRDGILCLWADAEWAWDEQSEGYAVKIGVDPTQLDLIQQQLAETVLDEILAFATKERGCLIVLDAVGALHPAAEAEKDSSSKTIGTQAKLVSAFCRRIVPLLVMHNHALLVLNHSFQDLMTPVVRPSGGMKLEYAKSLSISLKQSFGKAVSRASDGAKVGIVIQAEVMKNKLAATVGTKCDLMMIPGEGFSKEADRLERMLETGEVEKRGKSYYRGETKMGIGLRAARLWLKSNP